MRGHITKRGKNSWSIVLSLGYDPETGRRRQQWVSVKGTKRDAEKRLAELLHEVDTGGFVKPGKVTMAEYLRQWLQDYAASNVRPRTFQRYKGIIERHLIPALGHILLTQLKPSHVQACYTKSLKGRLDGREGELTAKTVLQHHRVLSEALSHAIKWGLVARNVAQAVDPPRPVNREMRTLDREGVRAFLEVARSTEYYPLFHLAVYTGLRRGEILGLRWKDVNLDMASLSVVQTLQRLKGGLTVFLGPKTAKGRRSVALSPAAVLVLRAHHERQGQLRAILDGRLSEDDLVFSHPDGSPLKPDTVSHAFSEIARKAPLRGLRLHDLRHTHATLMLQQGVHPKIVQERLGHANIAVTLDTYSHVLPGLQEAAALRFDEGLVLSRDEPLASSFPAEAVGRVG
jgi:integrase